MNDWVFIDTCIWASFLDKPNSPEKYAVDELIDLDRVALIGPVVTEVLLGFRRLDQANWVFSKLRLAHFVRLGLNDWRAAATLGRNLAAQGKRVQLTDLAVAAVAMRLNAFVFSSDPHFDFITGLKRYSPNT